MAIITYNTEEERLKLQKYGRLIQELIKRAKAIENQAGRQAMAERIVKVMAALNPQMRSHPNYKQTLWNHLAFLADYQLDIDYPYEIETYGKDKNPRKLSYPGNRIRFRHYGHLIEDTLMKLKEMGKNQPERKGIIKMLGIRMKGALTEWRGDYVDNEKVARDIEDYTDGAVCFDEAIQLLESANTPKRQFIPGKRLRK